MALIVLSGSMVSMASSVTLGKVSISVQDDMLRVWRDDTFSAFRFAHAGTPISQRRFQTGHGSECLFSRSQVIERLRFSAEHHSGPFACAQSFNDVGNAVIVSIKPLSNSKVFPFNLHKLNRAGAE